MRPYLRVLRDNPDFARLWLANVISLTGDWFNTIVLQALVTRYHPENAGLALAILLLARFVPPLVLSPSAGVLIDRFNRKWLLIWSSLLRGVAVLGFIPALNHPEWIGIIYTLTVVQFVLASVFEPGQAALINNLVKTDDLVIANTLFSITWSAILAFGAAVGGVVAVSFGEATALVFDSLTYVIAAWFIWQIKGYHFQPRASSLSTQTQAEQPNSTSFRDGLRYLRQRPDLAPVLLVKFGGSLGNVDTLMTIYATQIFILGKGGQLSLGIMYSIFGIGAVLGPVLLNRFNDDSVPRMRTLILIGFIGTMVCWLVMGTASTLLIFCIGLLIRAMGGSSNWTYSSVIIQKSADDHYMGRMFSLDLMAYYLATIISIVGHGALIDLVGNENAYLVALGTTVIALIPLTLWTWWTRRINSREAAPLTMIPSADASAGD
ncbi:MAG TPA: MFS transporter [Phototrophicaceae bacterium]|jgi:MFS family permease|nr:MFS transporter [Phototrophicaceae bacterium]